ncbi:MAG: hypothetical protein WD314_11190 [Trueperaceae bacterium]
MDLFDFLTSTRRPVAGVQALPAEELYERLLHLNRPAAPYRIIDGTPEHVDLIAEWKIVDAEWYELFAKAGISKVFRIFLKFDELKHHVRSLDREYGVAWRAGVPQLSIAASGFRGQKQSIEFGKAYAFTETLEPGVVYNYRFETREIKKPIQEAVTGSGWTYKGVTFGRL